MKKSILSGVFLFCFSGSSFAGFDFESKAQQLLGEILANPSAFFYDFQQDLEGTLPLPPGKAWGLHTGLFPSVIPMGYTNISGKYRLHAEGRMYPGLPQMDLIGGYWDMIWAKLATNQSDDVDKASFNGYYYGFILSSSVSPRIRTFWGYKRSQLKAELKLNKAQDLMGVSVTSFDSGFKDDFLIAGLEHPKGINKFWSIQLNYGLSEKIITTKVCWYGKWFELGLNIYPEGVLVIHPVWNFHLNF
ncbi:MAG: hypothetical protein HY746_08765 [Elusimicrobia bacterium]|nr:hypothetical protein [Elusimicrobiota bacterium]